MRRTTFLAALQNRNLQDLFVQQPGLFIEALNMLQSFPQGIKTALQQQQGYIASFYREMGQPTELPIGEGLSIIDLVQNPSLQREDILSEEKINGDKATVNLSHYNLASTKGFTALIATERVGSFFWSNLDTIDLSFNQLSKFSADFLDFLQYKAKVMEEPIESLILSHNKLTNSQLGSELLDWSQVKKFDLSHNKLTALPFLYANIEWLDLSFNQIGNVSPNGNYREAHELKFLNLAHNNIEFLPSDFLSDAWNLELLILDSNPIFDNPKAIRLLAPRVQQAIAAGHKWYSSLKRGAPESEGSEQEAHKKIKLNK